MLNIEFASSLGQGLWQFVSYMGLAIFAENVILAKHQFSYFFKPSLMLSIHKN